MSPRKDQPKETHRLECLARYFLTSRTREQTSKWLNKQAPAFRERMRELLNQEQQKNKEARQLNASRTRPMSAPRTAPTRRKIDAPSDAPRRPTPPPPKERGQLDELLAGLR